MCVTYVLHQSLFLHVQQSKLSETATNITYTETAQFNTVQYYSYRSHKEFLRKVSYYMNADEPRLFNEAGDTLLRQVSWVLSWELDCT